MNEAQPDTSKNTSRRKFLFIILAIIGLVILIPLMAAGIVYASSPQTIRNPKLEHYHFRMQIVVDGKKEDFSEDKYQQDYAKDQCNASLPEQPIHFHDKKDQFTHIHWEGMTGGMVLKYYGWNYIGGLNNALGYKLDDLKDIQKVNTHGNFLPARPTGSKIYVFTGNEKEFNERNPDDFVKQDLEQFFGVTSNAPSHEINEQNNVSILNKFLPRAASHGGADDGSDGEPGEESTQEKLTRINNLIGNVVIFAQKDRPTDDQIKDRFSNLEPLTASTCGG